MAMNGSDLMSALRDQLGIQGAGRAAGVMKMRSLSAVGSPQYEQGIQAPAPSRPVALASDGSVLSPTQIVSANPTLQGTRVAFYAGRANDFYIMAVERLPEWDTAGQWTINYESVCLLVPILRVLGVKITDKSNELRDLLEVPRAEPVREAVPEAPAPPPPSDGASEQLDPAGDAVDLGAGDGAETGPAGGDARGWEPPTG